MNDYTTTAAIVFIAIGLVRIVESLVAYILKGKGDKTDTKQDINIAVMAEKLSNIETNCLPTIEKRIEKVEDKLNKIYEIVSTLK